jgi:RNA polymerase sigma factor (sigma-70 family)
MFTAVSDETTRETMAEAILQSLTPREERIMRLSYGRFNFCEEQKELTGRHLTDKEIAQLITLSLERVQSIKAKAIRKIAHRVLYKPE